MAEAESEIAGSEVSGTGPRSNLAVGVLAFGAFVIGTAELVVVGVLDLIATDTGVSISTAGQLVTAYALGIAFGAPIIAALTTRFGRRLVLRVSLTAFVAGNLLTIAATSFDLLLIARVLTGTIHGLFAGVALTIAAGLVAPERRGQAISMVIGGITISTVVGVPLGTLIGQALGWQAAFVAIIALGVVALVATLLFVPTVAGGGGFGAQARAALAPRVLAMLAVGLLLFGGQFTAFTYLTPFLDDVTGISGGLVSLFLLAFGIAATAGTVLGGRAADHSATTTLLVANTVLIAALGALYLVGETPVLVGVALAAWGLAGFAIAPAVQLRVITLAGAGGDLAATLGVSAFNAGIAAGSLIGGAVISSDGADATVLTATILCAVALPATWATRFIKPAVITEPGETAPIGIAGRERRAPRLVAVHTCPGVSVPLSAAQAPGDAAGQGG